VCNVDNFVKIIHVKVLLKLLVSQSNGYRNGLKILYRHANSEKAFTDAKERKHFYNNMHEVDDKKIWKQSDPSEA
jgi:hypothetical protein